jgi:uncharacterized membrane protein (UPF0127 family)
MISPELVVLFAIAVVLIAQTAHFATAKGERRNITLVNSEGTNISIDAEIADNITTRAKGLMFRKSLGEYEGMLFVFKRADLYRFWMLNTTIPLDAIFIDENGTVVDVKEMEPCGLNVTKCPLYKPREKALYVLEVNKGFSRNHSILPGNSTYVLPRES